MKTYVTISVSEKDIDGIDDEDNKVAQKFHDVVDTALIMMIGNLVQLKITNLPMREES